MTQTIVAFATRKGGAGKTTTALCVAAIAASRGLRTLIVDLDQEGHATFGIGGNVNRAGSEEPAPGSGQLLMGGPAEPQHIRENLDLLAGNQELESPQIQRLEPETLGDMLAPLTYDLVVIDCPPNTHSLQKLGVVAAKSVVIPFDAHPFALNCATRLIQELDHRRSRNRPGATQWCVVASKIDLRRKLDQEAIQDARTLYKGLPFFKVSQDTALAICTTERVPITEMSPAPRPETQTELRKILDWSLGK